MLKTVKTVLTLSVLVMVSTSLAESSGFLDAQGKTLTVNSPIKFYIGIDSIPRDKWESIGKAVELANYELGAEKIKIGGIYISSKQIKDGINSITFSNDFQDEQASEQSRSSSYWSNGKINEIDIIVNTKNFDYSNDQIELVVTLKTQFKKIFGK